MNRMLINGQATDQLSAYDRAVQYGDGLFETIAVRNGVLLHWQRHMRRLLEACTRLAIPVPDLDALKQQAQSLIQEETSAVIKIIITRGAGGRGYRITGQMQPTTIVSMSEWPNYPAQNSTEGIRLCSCDMKLSQQPRLAGIKHLNRLEQILARQEWSDGSIAEGVMSDHEGHVIEGTMSNLFFIRQGIVYTPELSQCGVAGIMRELILEACDACGIEYRVAPVSLSQARQSEEIFITNSLIEVWPVRQWDDKTYTVNREFTLLLGNYINKKR